MHPAFSRFTKFPESLREAAASVPSRAGACRAWAAQLPDGAGAVFLYLHIKREGGMSQQHAAQKY